eukprot:1322773-Rhodomonas_salina.1
MVFAIQVGSCALARESVRACPNTRRGVRSDGRVCVAPGRSGPSTKGLPSAFCHSFQPKKRS